MLDIKKIKENPDAIKAGMKAKEVDCDAIVDKILELDVQVRGLKTATETLTAQKNKIAKENGKLFGQKKGMLGRLSIATRSSAFSSFSFAASSAISPSRRTDSALLASIWASMAAVSSPRFSMPFFWPNSLPFSLAILFF